MLLPSLALFAIPSPIWAEDKPDEWRTRVVADKPQVVFDPAKAYILVQTKGLQLPSFRRRPSEAEASAYAQLRASELAKEHIKWEHKLAGWQRDVDALKNTPGASRSKRPTEPTDANFAFPTYEQSHSFEMGPQARFAKNGQSIYLHEVPPGEYVYFGERTICACLGTVSFAAHAGKVVAVQIRFPWVEAYVGAPKDKRPKSQLDLPPGVSTLMLTASDYTDPRIPTGMLIAADFQPAGQFPNAGGGQVDRVMPMPGVFEYVRGKQIDLRTMPTPTSKP